LPRYGNSASSRHSAPVCHSISFEKIHFCFLVIAFSISAIVAHRSAVIVSPVASLRNPIGLRDDRLSRYCSEHALSSSVRSRLPSGATGALLGESSRRGRSGGNYYGLEGLHRVIQERGRMWRRYLATNLQFAGLLLKAILLMPQRQIRQSGPRAVQRPVAPRRRDEVRF
jgi:hypothetical protein